MTFGLVLLAAVAALLLVAGIIWKQRGGKSSGVLPPSQSIVLLLRQPALIETRELAASLGRIIGRVVAVKGPIAQRSPSDKFPPGDWIEGSSPHFLIHTDTIMFLVINLDALYISDATPTGWDIQKPEIREAVEQHTAWLATEIIEPQGASPADYQIPARLLESLIGDNCLVLYHPPLNRFKLYNFNTASSLRSESPVQAVFGA